MERRGDRISLLPEDLVLQIFSFLPHKDVVRTGVLSKRLCSIWKIVPKLEFDYQQHQRSGHEKFPDYVSRILLFNKAPVLESLHLHLNEASCPDAKEISKWLGIACSRHVRELILDVKEHVNFNLPRRLFNLSRSLYKCETLETLKLSLWVLVVIPSPVLCLKSLRTLHLYRVHYKNDATIVNLLSGCPNLENLVVKRKKWDDDDDVKTFTIAVPSLKRLEIYDWKGVGGETGDYVINAPSLKFLKFKGNHGLGFRLVEIAPELVEANIFHVFEGINDKLMRSLTSIKRLSLSLNLSDISSTGNTIFHQLVYLELSTKKTDWRNLLTLMINTSPRLQVLKLTHHCIKGDYVVEDYVFGEWNQPKDVPECLSLHLETFVWNGFKEYVREEKEVAKYILRNANHLKKANISIKGFNSEDERLELLEELENVVKASKSPCELLLY